MKTINGVKFSLIYSKDGGDLIGMQLISGDDIDDQAFLVTLLTKRNTEHEKFTFTDGYVIFHNSLFGPAFYGCDEYKLLSEMLIQGEYESHYAGLIHHVTPRIAFIKNGRDAEEVVIPGITPGI